MSSPLMVYTCGGCGGRYQTESNDGRMRATCPRCNPGRTANVPIVEGETLAQEQRRVFGACGGRCGELPCIEWNRVNRVNRRQVVR